jgi:mannose-6-phosphate isomerase-like protein (cupin superfamily)
MSRVDRTSASIGGGSYVIAKVNLREKFKRIDDYWAPRIAAEVNDFHVKLAKVSGEFVWHRHENEDELFLVVKGRLRIRLRDGEVALEAGEFAVVPRGIEHLPSADEETHVVLLEPKSTVNTGDVTNERTRRQLGRI